MVVWENIDWIIYLLSNENYSEVPGLVAVEGLAPIVVAGLLDPVEGLKPDPGRNTVPGL
jgi:hypothetical protein